MRNINRNDKQNQKQILQAQREARQTIYELHGLLARPGRSGLSVGEMVSLAATLGMLKPKKSVG